ncbi:hypothetical protein PVAP13_8NG329000 [Panicum virgatum]|uniref:Uncharacterized protein n=1 Tax=Panicum virgatum TaxID=38727 RepID=A0A8T0P9K7_PANVG|nr:hypothetical protein PVAP13_8NG329000 [Panicum virgatum]
MRICLAIYTTLSTESCNGMFRVGGQNLADALNLN